MIVTRTLGQQWRRCPWEWGIDDWVTVQSPAGRLVLCDLVHHMEGSNAGGTEVVPVAVSSLPVCPDLQVGCDGVKARWL